MIIRTADQPRFQNFLARGVKTSAAARSLRPLLLVGAMWLSVCHLWAQDVQVPTSGNSGGGADGGGGQVPRWKLPVQVSASVNIGYDTNANGASSNPEGSSSIGASINLGYDFGTLRTRVNLQTGTGFTYYPGLSTNRYDPNLFLNLSVSHQVNVKMTLAFSTSLNYTSEPNFSTLPGNGTTVPPTTLSSDRRVGNYFSTSDSLSLTYQWLPRWSTASSYSFSTILYDNTTAASAFNRFDHSFGQSIRFLYLPVTTLVLQYSFSASVYDTGTGRNTYSNSLLVGFDHTFSAKLQGFLRAGAGFTTTEGNAFQGNDGLNPNFSAGLSYAVSGKTTLSWNASYSLQPSYTALSGSSLSLSTGLVGSYAVTPRIHASLACYYRHDENAGIQIPGVDILGFHIPGIDTSSTDDSLDVSLSLSYSINRFLSANVAYDFTDVQYDVPGRSYTRSHFSGGLSVNF